MSFQTFENEDHKKKQLTIYERQCENGKKKNLIQKLIFLVYIFSTCLFYQSRNTCLYNFFRIKYI